VLHGFGSIVGLEYARKNQNNISSLVFYESHLKSIKLSRLSLPLQQMVYNLNSIKNLEKSLLETNLLLDLFLNNGVLKKLPKAILNNYYSHYKTPDERRFFLKYINLILNFDKKNEVNNIIENYSEFLINSDIPKCLLYSTPGMLATFETINWAKNNIKNLTVENVGHGLHFAQETVPYEFADVLSNWYLNKL
jgi:haloalkane dehalogenase